MAGGVRYGGERKKKPVDVDLVSPTGARITVSEERAETLLQRAPVPMPDGESRGYRIDNGDDEPARKSMGSGRQDRLSAAQLEAQQKSEKNDDAKGGDK